MQMFNLMIWQRPLLVREVKHGPEHMPPSRPGWSDSPKHIKEGTRCLSQNLPHPVVSVAISSVICRGEVRSYPAFPRFQLLEKLTLFRLQGTIEMKQQQQNHLAAHHCINATGSLLEWKQNASEQLTSGGSFCPQTVKQNCIYIQIYIYIFYFPCFVSSN